MPKEKQPPSSMPSKTKDKATVYEPPKMDLLGKVDELTLACVSGFNDSWACLPCSSLGATKQALLPTICATAT